MSDKCLPNKLSAAHPQIKITTDLPAYNGMQGWVYKIRSAFKRLHFIAHLAHGSHDAETDCGLTATGVGAGNEKG